jgi:hypothetical protein
MPNELVTVATYPNAIEAHAARNFLEGNEIETFVADEYFSTLEFSNLSTIKLQVPVADAQRARELLNSRPIARRTYPKGARRLLWGIIVFLLLAPAVYSLAQIILGR